MMTTILLNYPQYIALGLWELCALIALLRYFEVSIFRKVSWGWMASLAVVLHLTYDALLSWGQYVVWTHTEITRVFLLSPLPAPVPLAWWMEWTRPFLSHAHGYFAFYAFNHFFLSTVVLFFVVLLLSILLKLWSVYRPRNFKKGDVLAITCSLVVAGWPGIIVLVPMAFILLVLLSVGNIFFFKKEKLHLPVGFLIALPLILFSGSWLLKILNLYTLFKI